MRYEIGGYPDGAGGGRLVMMDGMGTSADAGDAPAAPGRTPYLPAPTGPSPAGTTSLYLKDGSRAYVRAFFDQNLSSKPQALLDQPSPRYSEVTFCSPEARTGP